MPQETVIEMEGLKKSFGDKAVLINMCLNVKKGENVVVIGKSGTGKSVTIKCIAGLLSPDAGSLKVFGEEVQTMDEEQLKAMRHRLGFLFQGAALYDSMTVRQNLAFPLKRVLHLQDKDEIEARCVEVLKAVNLEDAIDKMPADLSGGMRKRMGLARTLVLKPEIILYDEPTTGLDTITSKEISHLILDMQEQYQTTAVIITHDMPCAKITGDKILVMDEGCCLAEGTYEELEHSNNHFIQSFFK